MSLDILTNQLEGALESEFYFLALATALSVPDFAAAIDSDNGKATGAKYKTWYDKWVRPRFSINVNQIFETRGITQTIELENPFDGAECYYYRCAMLHQARSTHDKSAFSRVMFIEPKSTSSIVHYGILNDALTIDLPSFCLEVVQGYRDWVTFARVTENYERNIANTMQRYSNGLKPYIGGVPVIS
ncbi:hypothetical protein [Yoonia sp.]|uniref:hypothetical protein n=1 Tax=Yoonia sp. TaxID=2212373 RepID=UPI003919B891